jgi:hypothetical protein
MGLRIAFVLLTVLALAGCRDLDIPSSLNGRNPGPTLAFLSPQPLPDGGVPQMSLQGFVAVTAEDADGVASVDLSCEAGGNTGGLAHLTVEPFQSSVNFAPCRPPGTPNGTSIALTLTAVGTDSLGNSSSQAQNLQVLVDGTVAALTLDAPPRVAPSQAFDLFVDSDLPLLSPPSVEVDSVPAVFIGSDISPGKNHYQFHVAQAPPLGADRVPSGPVPLNILEETERALGVHVEAKAATGNTSELTGQIILARVLWDRALPVPALAGAAESTLVPTATSTGVVVPIQVPSGWEPVFLDLADGAPSFIPSASIPLAFLPRGINGLGQPIYNSRSGTPWKTRIFDMPSGATVRDAQVLLSSARPLGRVGGFACEETMSATTVCPATATMVTCIGPTSEVQISAGIVAYNTSTAPYMAASNNVLLVGGLTTPVCAANQSIRLFDLSNATAPASYAFGPFLRTFGVGDGSFFGAFQDTFGTEIRQFNASNGSIQNTTTGPPTLPGLGLLFNYTELLLARPDGSIVAYKSNPPYTYFGAWNVAAGTVSPLTNIPITLEFGFTPSRVQENAILASNGDIYLLLRRYGVASGERVAVLRLDSNLQARWLYLYPRNDPGTNAYDFHLAVDDVNGRIYLVDGSNGYAVALAR